MRGFWYPVLRTTRVRGRELRTAKLLDIPPVIMRTSRDEGLALRDACPHWARPSAMYPSWQPFFASS